MMEGDPCKPQIVPSRRTLPGKPFTPVAEALLADGIVELALRLPHAHRKGLVLLEEVPGPFGVPDFVAVVPDGVRFRARRALAVPPLLIEADAMLVTELHAGRPTRASTLAVRLGWSLTGVEDRLNRLRRIGAVARDGPSGWIRSPALAPIGRIHVIEAKVRDLARAVQQASAYAAWGDTASVLMPSKRATFLPPAEPAWLGWALGDRWVRRPVMLRHSPSRRLWASEHILAAM